MSITYIFPLWFVKQKKKNLFPKKRSPNDISYLNVCLCVCWFILCDYTNFWVKNFLHCFLIIIQTKHLFTPFDKIFIVANILLFIWENAIWWKIGPNGAIGADKLRLLTLYTILLYLCMCVRCAGIITIFSDILYTTNNHHQRQQPLNIQLNT